jgi:GDP/UDP-N,N'-diacetylbacillosamine 2-epimerase (hydrolysing)
MSQLHFVTTETYRKRVIQLGEQPEMVFNVGALGVENIKQICLLERKQLEEDIHFTFSDKTVMVTFHPVTLEQMTAEKQFNNLLLVIENHKELKVIFTKANSDTDGRVINRMIDKFVENNKDRCVAFTSLGQLRYLSSLRFCCAVMGNSSSGIIEVPSFGIPTVNIGDRQKGRVRALSVIDCGNTEREIENAVVQALSGEFRDSIADVKNPYEGENTSEKILQIIGEKLQQGIDIKKSFYNFNEA